MVCYHHLHQKPLKYSYTPIQLSICQIFPAWNSSICNQQTSLLNQHCMHVTTSELSRIFNSHMKVVDRISATWLSVFNPEGLFCFIHRSFLLYSYLIIFFHNIFDFLLIFIKCATIICLALLKCFKVSL